MQYRSLGRTGVQVSSLALGAMNFGTMGRTTQDDVTGIVDAALEAGINLIDTADIYSGGESEEMVGKAIAGRRDDVVLATKAGLPMGDERNHRGSSRRWLLTEMDNSLRRLGVDHVDLYQVHRWDPSTSDEETLSALTSALIGPRTMDHLHSQLAAADTVLSADILDAIDAIVAPGTDLAVRERIDTPRALLDPSLRRR
jgi:aryl-alcohol dehydrogenase-like predicted oxidoreductase